jgi:Domain of unknown function (DUF4034)
MKSLWLGIGISVLVALGAYAWLSYGTPGGRAFNGASAMVTLSESGVGCAVKRSRFDRAREVPCREVGSYLRDSLKLPQGATVAITALGQASLDAIAALTNELYVHGLEVAIVKREGFASASDAAPPPPLPVSDTGGPTAKDCDGVPPPCQSNPSQGISMAPGTDTLQAMQNDGLIGATRVGSNALMLYYDKRYHDLDNLIARYVTLQDRIDDGRFKLSGIGEFMDMAVQQRPPGVALPEIQDWRSADPNSPGAALLEAAYWRNAAWTARGNGFANTVSPEGWRLFHERLQHALKTLTDSESYAARNPLWYTESLDANIGLGVSRQKQFALYERGIVAFPDYYPLHCQMAQGLLPKWGGSNKAVADFIKSVTKRSAPATKAQMYTRLWWCVDNSTTLDVNVFRDMGASWTRIKVGFESLNESYPGSLWNRSNYASFACRAGDIRTYRRLRTELGDRINIYAKQAFPANVSLDICDHRAAHRDSASVSPGGGRRSE